MIANTINVKAIQKNYQNENKKEVKRIKGSNRDNYYILVLKKIIVKLFSIYQ